MSEKTFGQFLVGEGLIDDADFTRALQRAWSRGTSLVAQLKDLRFAEEREIAEVAAQACGLTYLDLTTAPSSAQEAIDLVPKEFAETRRCLPLWIDGHVLTVAVANPLDAALEADIMALTGYEVRRVVVLDSSVQVLVSQLYSPEARSGDGSSSEDLVKAMLVDAIQAGGDIHIMPTEHGWRACLCIEDDTEDLFEMNAKTYKEVSGLFKKFLGPSNAEGGEFRIRTSLDEEITFFLDVDVDPTGEQLFVCLLEREVIQPNDVAFDVVLPKEVVADLERAASVNGMCIGSLIQRAWTMTRDVINTACVCPCATPRQEERVMTVRLPRETVADLEDAAQKNGRSIDWVLLKTLVMARECLLKLGKPKST